MESRYVMTAIAHHPATTWFDLIAIRRGGNESARRHQSHFPPKPSARRLERGLNPSKTCLMSHNVDVALNTPHVATPRFTGSRLFATLQSPQRLQPHCRFVQTRFCS